jgi:predicted transcriptional regulator
MGAQTYAIVRPNPNLKISITGTPQSNGETLYSGKIQERLEFRAQMDRSRSWWNPTLEGVPEAYVLEHEQIHFAIAEAQAQKLNARADELTARMHATGDSKDEVADAIKQKLDDVIRGALDELLERNRAFDEDTSARYDPKKQAEWLRRLTREIGEKAQ